MYLTCEGCKKTVSWLVERNGKWIGPECVPDDLWSQYPGWRERENLRLQRAE
jgi:hypothetical protein